MLLGGATDLVNFGPHPVTDLFNVAIYFVNVSPGAADLVNIAGSQIMNSLVLFGLDLFFRLA